MALFRLKDSSFWWVTLVNPRTGQRIRRSTKLRDKSQAKRFEEQLMASLVLGEDHYSLRQAKPVHLWREAMQRWLEETKEKKDHANDQFKARWLAPYLDHLELSVISPSLVQRIGKVKAAESSPATANRTLALIRAVLHRARDQWEWLDKAPSIRLNRENTKRIRYLTKQEAQALIAELPPHLAHQALFTLYTGLRASNVCRLKWSQIDLTRNHLWIDAAQAKAGKAIPVPLSADALTLLQQRQGEHPEYVFTLQGKPLARPNNSAWRAALKRINLRDFRWHDLRHTWATWHIQGGTPLHVLQELGGWSSYEMVRRYAHLTSDHLRQYVSNTSL